MTSQSKAQIMARLQGEYPTYNMGLQNYLHKFYLLKDTEPIRLDKQKHSGCSHTSELRKLINLRKGFLDRKCDEFLIAVYDLRAEDMETDKMQLRFSIVDTLERLKTEIKKYSNRLQ